MKLGGALAMASFLSTAAWCRRSSAFLPTATTRGSSARRIAAAHQLFSGSSGRSAVPTLQSNAVLRSSPAASASRLFSTAVAKEPAAVEEEEELPTNESDIDLLKLRHTSAHVMAMAVQQTFPEAQVTIGPWIDNGFYYDLEAQCAKGRGIVGIPRIGVDLHDGGGASSRHRRPSGDLGFSSWWDRGDCCGRRRMDCRGESRQSPCFCGPGRPSFAQRLVWTHEGGGECPNLMWRRLFAKSRPILTAISGGLGA